METESIIEVTRGWEAWGIGNDYISGTEFKLAKLKIF